MPQAPSAPTSIIAAPQKLPEVQAEVQPSLLHNVSWPERNVPIMANYIFYLLLLFFYQGEKNNANKIAVLNRC